MSSGPGLSYGLTCGVGTSVPSIPAQSPVPRWLQREPGFDKTPAFSGKVS